MSFWAEVVGQTEAVSVLDRAATAAVHGDSEGTTHAWLITGPPGSGRITVARRFAAALVAKDTSAAAREAAYAMVDAGTHPDVTVVSTQANQLDVAVVRGAVRTAYFAPAESRVKVIVVEDADRMNQHSANAMLKALEEPPETSVWVLCAPSEADLLPTIRSRTRMVRLRTPDVAEVAELLTTRDGISPDEAEKAARLAQGHIGMARRLASDAEAMARRERTIQIALSVDSLSDAMRAAAELFEIAKADGAALIEAQGDAERDALRRTLGLAEGEAVPRTVRGQFKQLDDDLKRRQSRSLKDGVDRVLVDLLTLCRDVLFAVLDPQLPLVNEAHRDQILQRASLTSVGHALDAARAVEQARERMLWNVRPELVLEAVFARQIAARAKTESELAG